jgi:hypothetical protein
METPTVRTVSTFNFLYEFIVLFYSFPYSDLQVKRRERAGATLKTVGAKRVILPVAFLAWTIDKVISSIKRNS